MLPLAAAALLAVAVTAEPCSWESTELAKDADIEDVFVAATGRVLVVLRDIGTRRAVRVVRASDDGGKTWLTLNRTPYDQRDDLLGASLVGLADGTLLLGEFVVRDYSQFKPGSTSRRALLASSDGGRSWRTSDVLPPPDQHLAWAAGRLWSWGSGDRDWWIEQSADRGKSWQRSDTFQLDGQTIPYSFGADEQGQLFVAGLAMTGYSGGPQECFWAVRRSSDQGASWKTVDRFPDPGGKAWAEARAVGLGKKGALYVAGKLGMGEGAWVVRASRDSGDTWRTVDSLPVGYHASPHGIAVGADGTVFVVGALDTPGIEVGSAADRQQWLVRASRNGQDWITTDLFSDPRYRDYWADRVVVAPKGEVLVFGRGMGMKDLGNRMSEAFYAPVLVRRLCCGANPLPVSSRALTAPEPPSQPAPQPVPVSR